MRVLHVTGAFAPTMAYTGPPAALHRLCRELVVQGVEVRVATTDTDGSRRIDLPTNRWIEFDGVPAFYGRRFGPRGHFSWPLVRCISHEAALADLIHVTSIFSWTIFPAARARRLARTPLIVSPRGSFAPEALAWHAQRKRAFLTLGGRRAFAVVDAFHATTAEEERDVQALYPDKPVGRVPNGVEIPTDCELASWSSAPAAPYVLYLGRLHPHKNIDLLIRAWARARDLHGSTRLVIAGPDLGGIERELRALAEREGVAASVDFVGRKDGADKGRLLAGALSLVLPSKSENFGNVVAEALAHATPVVTSRGTPWADAERRGCGFWVDASEEPMAAALRTVLSLTPERRVAMGLAGRKWMQEAFSWPVVARQMTAFYEMTLERRGGMRADSDPGSPRA